MSSLGIRQSSSLSYVPGLDGIRAIAVIAVMLRHYTSPFTPVLTDAGWAWSFYTAIANLGWVGVDIFFVISGYLIATMLINRPVRTLGDYGTFLSRRVWRLLPAYLACLLIFSAIAVMFTPDSKVLNNSLHLWTMTSNIQSSFIHRTALMDAHFNLVHFWSLAVEWHFYLVLPLLLWVFRSVGFTALLLIVLAIATRWVLQHFNASDNAIYSFTLCRMDALAMGCLLAVIKPGIPARLNPLIALAGAALFIGVMWTITQSPIPYKKLLWMQLYGYTLIALATGMMLVGIVNATRANLAIRLLEKPAMLTIGRGSYSLYIWHLVFFPTIANFTLQHFEQPLMAFMAAFVIASITAAIAATASFKLVESTFYLAHRTPRSSPSAPNP